LAVVGTIKTRERTATAVPCKSFPVALWRADKLIRSNSRPQRCRDVAQRRNHFARMYHKLSSYLGDGDESELYHSAARCAAIDTSGSWACAMRQRVVAAESWPSPTLLDSLNLPWNACSFALSRTSDLACYTKEGKRRRKVKKPAVQKTPGRQLPQLAGLGKGEAGGAVDSTYVYIGQLQCCQGICCLTDHSTYPVVQ
jgi:hypothetical protein